MNEDFSALKFICFIMDNATSCDGNHVTWDKYVLYIRKKICPTKMYIPKHYPKINLEIDIRSNGSPVIYGHNIKDPKDIAIVLEKWVAASDRKDTSAATETLRNLDPITVAKVKAYEL